MDKTQISLIDACNAVAREPQRAGHGDRRRRRAIPRAPGHATTDLSYIDHDHDRAGWAQRLQAWRCTYDILNDAITNAAMST